MYTRQFPAVAATVREVVSPLCTQDKLPVRASVFASLNDGPFVRLIDPSIDLAGVYDALKQRSLLPSLFHTALDKMPNGYEFILRRVGSIEARQEVGWHTFVDRSPCLMVDPLHLFDVSVAVKVARSPVPLFARLCAQGNENDCETVPLSEAPVVLPRRRSIAIQTGLEKPPMTSCADSVLIELFA